MGTSNMAAKNATRADDQTVNDSIDDSAAATETPDAHFSDVQLRGVSSFEEAMQLATETFGDVLDAADEIGSGFVKLENKDRLVDTEFVILSYSMSEGDFRDTDGFLQHFVSARIVTRAGEKFFFTDGGTGIYRQLEDLAVRSGRTGGIHVKNGLRRSEYTWVDKNGNDQPGVTHYLNV
jgi:hypothetical protein